MFKKESDPDDPIEMIGVELPHQTEEQLKDMALCFAEEFVREGWEEDQLMNLFKNPFYHGPYLVWKQKGDDFVRSVILEALKMWRPYGRTNKINPAKAAAPEAGESALQAQGRDLAKVGGPRSFPSKQKEMQKNEREEHHGPGL